MKQKIRKRRRGAALHVTRLTAVLVGGTAAIVVACIVVILWVLNVASASVDATEANGERRLLRSVFDTYQNNLSRGVADYASWDELYTNFTGTRRSNWEKENLGPYIARTFGVDLVAVTSDNGSVVYRYSKDRHDNASISPADSDTLARLTLLASKTKLPDTASPISGVIEFNNIASLVSASPILPTSPIRSSDRSGFSLVEIRAIDSQFLSKIENDFGIVGLHATRSLATGVALRTPMNTASGLVLTWTPSKVGHRLFMRVLVPVVAVGILMLVGFLGLAALWRKIVDHIRANETRVLNAEIETTRAQAHAAGEMARNKSAFIANMSHELRTPLNAIIGFSEFIERETLGPIGVPKYREYIADINKSGHHLLKIINDILLVSKIEVGKFKPKMENLPLADILNDSVQMLEVIAARRKIRLNTSRFSYHPMVYADGRALRQILINVISNAVKFSPEDETVDIECTGTDSNGAVDLRVVDRGCGIPPETLRELGKPFVQAEGTYSRKFDGTGLGLAICYRLAEQMGASIDVTSAMKVGTTVRILIKGAQAKPRAATPETVEAA